MKKSLLVFLIASFFFFIPFLHKTDAQTATYNITGTVFDDINQNGIQDLGEVGHEGVNVSLGHVNYTQTDADVILLGY